MERTIPFRPIVKILVKPAMTDFSGVRREADGASNLVLVVSLIGVSLPIVPDMDSSSSRTLDESSRISSCVDDLG